jgi:hemerythrin-like domain-containing protein
MGELCKTLRDEHRIIERVLNAMASEAVRIQSGDPVNADFVRGAVSFFTEYADGFHHLKEETVLFPMLERAGLPRGNSPLDNMLSDHIDSRALMTAISDSVDDAVRNHSEARNRVAEGMATYVAMTRRHIDQEENMIYPMAEQMVQGAGRVEVEKSFIGADEQMTDAARRERAWAESLGNQECQTGITEPAELVWEESDLYV